MTRSYYTKYRSNVPGKCLLGGVMSSQSSRFQIRSEAEQSLQTTLELNQHANATGEICESELPPEIFRHCGEYSTTYGAKCNGCGKVLTKEDAKNAPAKLIP